MRTTAGRILRWIGKALLWLAGALLALAVIGAIYQAVATQRDERAYPPPGKMVEVAAHRMHIYCVGEGSPTVVFESGLEFMSAGWANVQSEVAKTTHVCAYDRAGIGWSERGPELRDAKQISGELHTLLKDAGTEGPYVLVGHSYSGLYVRMYAARYPKEVAGMVLVDSSHPEQWARLPGGHKEYQQINRLFALTPWAARLGMFRLFSLNPAPPGLPPHPRAQVEAFNSSTRQVSTTAEEFRANAETMTEVRSTGSLGDKPLAVVSAGEQRPAWLKLQDDLATLSFNSIHRVVEGATHTSLVVDPRDVEVTSAAIQKVVEAVRKDQPLTR